MMEKTKGCHVARIFLITSVILLVGVPSVYFFFCTGKSSWRMASLRRKAQSLTAAAVSKGDAVAQLARLMNKEFASSSWNRTDVISVLGQPSQGDLRALELEYRFPGETDLGQALLVWFSTDGKALGSVRVVRSAGRIQGSAVIGRERDMCRVKEIHALLLGGGVPKSERKRMLEDIREILGFHARQYGLSCNDVVGVLGPPDWASVWVEGADQKNAPDGFRLSYEYRIEECYVHSLLFSFNSENQGLAFCVGGGRSIL